MSTFTLGNDTYVVRHATRYDAPFIYGLYAICADDSRFQAALPKDRVMNFTSDCAIFREADAEYKETHYFIIDDDQRQPVGLLSNRRGHLAGAELVGMLISPYFQGIGLGRHVLSNFSAFRKSSGTPLLEGIIADSNNACIKASLAAGAKISGKRKFVYSNQNVDVCVVEFFRKEQSSDGK